MRALSVRVRGEGIEPVPDSDRGGGAIPMQSRRYARVVRGRGRRLLWQIVRIFGQVCR
jgi:hypothetical protein